MAGIIQVTFNPQLWCANNDGSGPGYNGSDCFSVWPHGDGSTLWVFEWYGCGFAHLNYSDGAILRQDMHYASNRADLVTREDGNVVFTHDDSGNIYLVTYTNGHHTLGNLFKLHVSSSPSASPAKVSSTSMASNIVTFVANNSFAAGDYVYVQAPNNQSQVNATWLIETYFIVLTASSTQFTAWSYVTNPDYTNLPETEMTVINTTGTILNGYETVDGVYALDSTYLEDIKWFSSGGTGYVATSDGSNLTVVNTDTIGVSIAGSETTGMSLVFGYWDSSSGTPGETMIQNTSGATATYIGFASEPNNPQYYGMTITGITGTPNATDNWIGQSSGAQWDTATGGPISGLPTSITGFLYGEQIVQNNTNASTYIFGLPSGSNPINVDVISGTENNTDIWVGQTTGAVFTPTATSVAQGLVGTFPATNYYNTNAYLWNSFADSNGIMWALVANGGYSTYADHGTTLFRWDPADGADGSGQLIMQTKYLSNAPTFVQGRVTSGTFKTGEAVVQNTTGATANLVGGANNNSQTGPLYLTVPTGSPSFSDTWVGQESGAVFTPSITGPFLHGSVTSGTFQVNETITQNVTGATATMIGKVTGNYALFIGTSISGTADDTNAWVGDSSGAVYTPTPMPITSTTQNTNLAYAVVSMAYIPSTHSVFFSSDLSTATGDACVIDMTTWNRTAYQPDNLEFIVDLDYDESEEGVDLGYQGTQMMVEGSSGPGNPFQCGGILNVVNPDLSIAQSIDVVSKIRENPSLLQIQETEFNHAQDGYVSNVSQTSGGATTITCTYHNMIVGQSVNFQDIAYATWLNSLPFNGVQITAVTPTTFSITTPDHSPYNHFEPAPYSVAYCGGNRVIPTLCSYAWNPTTNQVATVFNFTGTPVYIVPTAEALFNPASGNTTLTVANAGTTTVITSVTPNPCYPNQSVAITVNVSVQGGGFPTEGQVQLYNGGYAFGAPQNVDPVTGNVTFTTDTIFQLGANVITAGYDDNNNFGFGNFGDTNAYEPSTSDPVTVTCNASPTVTTLTSTQNPGTQGSNLTYNVTVTASFGTPQGTVQLLLNGSPLTTLTLDVNGQASYTTNTTPLGTNTVEAVYTPVAPVELPTAVIQTQQFSSTTAGFQANLTFASPTQNGSLVIAHQYGDGEFFND